MWRRGAIHEWKTSLSDLIGEISDEVDLLSRSGIKTPSITCI